MGDYLQECFRSQTTLNFLFSSMVKDVLSEEIKGRMLSDVDTQWNCSNEIRLYFSNLLFLGDKVVSFSFATKQE